MQIFPLDILVVFFSARTQTTFSIWAAVSVYGSTVCIYAPSSASCIRLWSHHPARHIVAGLVSRCARSHLCVIVCNWDKSKPRNLDFCHLLVCSHFHQRPAVEWAISFSLNLPSVKGQAPNMSDDCASIQGSLVFFKLLSCNVANINQGLIHKFFFTNSYLDSLSCCIYSYGTSTL